MTVILRPEGGVGFSQGEKKKRAVGGEGVPDRGKRDSESPDKGVSLVHSRS